MDFTREKIEAIYDAALAAGDDERASMACCLLKAEVEFGKQTDLMRALAAKSRDFLTLVRGAWSYASEGLIGTRGAELEEMVMNIIAGTVGEPMIRELHYEGGAFRMGVSHWAAGMIGASLSGTLQKSAGEFWNFVEMQVTTRECGPVLVIVQRMTGQTPNDLRKAAETALEMTREVLRQARPFVEDRLMASTTVTESYKSQLDSLLRRIDVALGAT